jgi:hypothetical protein
VAKGKRTFQPNKSAPSPRARLSLADAYQGGAGHRVRPAPQGPPRTNCLI